MVAWTSAMRTGVIWSTEPVPMDTRDGGRYTKPDSSFVPKNPYFQAVVRNEGGAAGRSGSGRRGGSRRRNPRHVRNWAYDRSSRVVAIWSCTDGDGRRAVIASVVRHRVTVQPSANVTTAMVRPGS